MEEIKVGEYCRYDDGTIIKVVEEEESLYNYLLKNKKGLFKHSPNIIELIEEGDYVNGSKVLDVMEDMKTGEVHLEMTMNYTNEELGDCTIYNKDIKTIVTKEQFESISYKL